jgi:hypothetical protein
MNDSQNDKAAKDLRFIEKSLKVAWVLYGLGIFFYVVGKRPDGTLSSITVAAGFCGLLIYCVVSLIVWRFQHREAALFRLRERWIKCLLHVGAMSILIIGPILLSFFFPVER